MSRRREDRITPADRRYLRWLPITLLFQGQRGQPDRLFRECPQMHRLRRNGLIQVSYDASANALTINRSTAAEERLASAFTLPPASVLPDPRR